jgi:pimeloyl-ACP methyl ester carboxylesterase
MSDDLLALIDELGLEDYDLAGYSLGGKAVLRLVARGGRYRGTADARGARGGDDAVGGAVRRGPTGGSRLIGSSVATPPASLGSVQLPVLIVVGMEDSRGDSADELAALLPDARVARVPGDHVTAPDAPEYVAALVEFLG